MNFNPYQNYGAGIAALGPVQSMSDRNENQTLMANSGQMFASGGIARLAEGGALPKYKYDPVSQTYVLSDDSGSKTAMDETLQRQQRPAVGDIGSYDSKPSGWDLMSNAEKAAYYAENPLMGKATQTLQDLFGRTGLGALSAYVDPQAYGEAQAVAKGFDPSQTSFGRGAGSVFGLFGSGQEAVPKEGVDVYGYAPVGASTNYGDNQHGGPGPAGSGSTGGGLGGVGGEGTPGANGPGDGTAADYAYGGLASLARGGMSHLGDYSDGGRFLRNADGGITSDGISDSIPASIGGKRPARLAENEFVIPARIVSELGNGSSEAGARRLYAMMDRIQKARGKTVGKGKVAVDSKAEKYLPA